VFEELAEAHFSAKETMKAVAYKKVAKALRETEQVITAGKQAQKLPGIGKSSAEKASASVRLLCLRVPLHVLRSRRALMGQLTCALCSD
jgi:hypothetical protein